MPGTCDGRVVATVEDLCEDLIERTKGSDLVYDLVLLRACIETTAGLRHQVVLYWEPKSENIKKKMRDFVPMEDSKI